MRFESLSMAAIGVLALVAAGCASGGGSNSADQAALAKLGPAELQWSGNFRPNQNLVSSLPTSMASSSDASTQPSFAQASGTVVLTAPNPTQIRAKLNVNMPSLGTTSERLPWVISQGSCGSDNLPVMSVENFPEITVNQGSGRLDEMLSVAFPTSGTYHVAILQQGSNGTDESQVIVCADLSLSQRRGS